MAKISTILSYIRDMAPESATQPDFEDNVGLLVGSEAGSTVKVLLCLDCTEAVVAEAEKLGAKLIISHHPVIFRSFRRVTDEDPVGRTVLAAARAGITVYSAHTNLDFCNGGINDCVARIAGLENARAMEVIDGIAVGRIGEVNTTVGELAKGLADACGDRHVRIVGDAKTPLRRVAIINGGAGSLEYVKLAAELGADCYATADVPHHVLLYAARSGMNLIVMQHYAMERVYLSELAERLTEYAVKDGSDAEFIVSKTETDPVLQEDL